MRTLCVGNDHALLRTRCAVLKKAGYECDFLFPRQVALALKSQYFDLCILSAMVSAKDKVDVIALVADVMPIIKLETLVLAPELLKMARRFLNEAENGG